jgi:hypothetical protein
MREQTTIRFKISSATLSPQDIEAKLGLKPDDFWKAGTARGAFGAVEKKHGFVVDSKLPPNRSLEEHMKEMIQRLAPYAQKIGALGAAVEVEFACTIHRERAPRLKFLRDDIRWLGVMGARLDVDVFTVSEPPKPKPGGAAGGAPTSGS